MKLHVSSISWQVVVVILATLLGTVLRSWNYIPTLMFQGDQARDALIVSNIFINKDPVFIGPVTSVGNMYLGPLYYYFMLPWLMLSYPSPLGPAIAITILGIVAVPLTYLVAKELLGKTPAAIAALMMAISSVLVTSSRFSWNPNPAPIVMLLVIWATYRAWTKSAWYWLLATLGFCILIQLHYLSLLAVGGIGSIGLIQIVGMVRNRASIGAWRTLVLAVIASVVLFAVSLTPLILFDLKHEGLNTKAFASLFSKEKIIDPQESSSFALKVAAIARNTNGRAQTILYDHLFGKNQLVGMLSVAALVAASIVVLQKSKGDNRNGLTLLISFLIPAVVGTALYQHAIFDHYLLFIFPVAFMFWGYWLGTLTQAKWGILITVVTLVAYAGYNLMHMPFGAQAWTILDVKHTAEVIYPQLKDGEKYSLVLLGPSKDLYAQNYRYYLSTTDRPPLPPERAAEADTLVVINEEHVADVANVPIYEIVIFPNKANPSTLTIPGGPDISIFRR